MDMPLLAGGEQILFLLFVLFSIVSALLERRKRKKQREEDLKGGPVQRDLVEDGEAEVGSWPFPMGGDPFERKPRVRGSRRQPTEEAGSPPVERPAADFRGLAVPDAEETASRRTLDEVQAEADIARTLAQSMERQARTADPVPRQVQPRRRVQELVKERVAQDEVRDPHRRRRKRSRWALTPKTARDAVVYMEILGRPKGERLGDEFDR